MLIQRGASAVISLPAQRLLAEMFVPSVVRTNAKEAKNAAARLSHWLILQRYKQRTLDRSMVNLQSRWVPENLTVENLAGGCDDDPDETDEREDRRDNQNLYHLSSPVSI